ncbi:MAG: trigger factor, partial [Calditrichota bacterium]
MNIHAEITDDYNGKVTVEFPQEEAAPQFAQALKDFQANAKLSGFRPGKTPLSYIRARYAKALFEEKAEEIAQKHLEEIMKQVELKPGGQLTLNLLEYGDAQPLRFEIRFPLRPEPTLSVYKGLRLTVNEVQVTEADVDHQIKAHRHKHALMQSIDTPAPVEARIYARVQEIDPSGLPLIGRPVEERELELGLDILGPGSDEQLMGIRAGEKRTIQARNPHLLLKTHQRHIISPAEASGQEDSSDDIFYQVEALRVETPMLPDLDDDFASKINERFKTFAELRDWVKADLVSLTVDYFSRQVRSAVKRHLVEENPFRLSSYYVQSLIDEMASQSKLKPDELRKYRENHAKEIEYDLKWDLLS